MLQSEVYASELLASATSPDEGFVRCFGQAAGTEVANEGHIVGC